MYHTRCFQKAKSVILEPIKGMVKWIAKHEHHKFISIYLFHNLNYCNNSNFVLQSIQFLACTDSQFWHNNLIYLLFPYESEEKHLRYKTITIKSALTLTIFFTFPPPPWIVPQSGTSQINMEVSRVQKPRGGESAPPRNVGLIVKYFIATNLL